MVLEGSFEKAEELLFGTIIRTSETLFDTSSKTCSEACNRQRNITDPAIFSVMLRPLVNG